MHTPSAIPHASDGNAPSQPQPAADPRDRFFERGYLSDNLRARSASSGIITALSQGLRLALRTLSIPILNRLLLPDDFGVFSVVLAITAMVGMLSFSGLTMATVQRERISHAQVSALFWINTGISFLLAIITLAAAPFVAIFYNDPRTGWVTAAMSVTVLLAGLVLQHQAILTRQMHAKQIAASDLTSQILGIIAAIIAAWAGAGYWALVIQQIATQVIFMLGVFWCCRWIPSRPRRATGVGEMVGFGLDLTWTNLVSMAARQIDLSVVGRTFGTEVAGFYSRSYAVLQLPVAQFVQPMAGVALPMLSVLRSEPDRLRSGWRQLQEKLALVTMPPIAGLIATSDWSIRILLGPQWGQTAELFAILGFLGFVQPVFVAHHWLFIACDRTRQLLYANIVLLALTAIGALTLVSKGASGVALGMALSTAALQVPFQFWYTARCTPVRLSDLLRAIVPGVAYAAATFTGAVAARQYIPFGSESMADSIKGLAIATGASLAACTLTYLAVPPLRTPVRHAIEMALGPILRRLRRPTPVESAS